jgi:large subunit ribosomal protein L15
MPLQRRLPKRGFHNHSRVEYEIVSLARIARFPEGTVVDPEMLRRERIVRTGSPIKILSDGDLNAKLVVKAHAASGKARAKIEAAGGTLEILSRA